MTWDVILYSVDLKFNKVFEQATDGMLFHDEKVNLLTETSWSKFKKQIIAAFNASVIHINMDACMEDSYENILSYIRNEEKFRHLQLILWMRTPWIDLDQKYVNDLHINDIRSTKNLDLKRIKYILNINLINQKNILNIVDLNANLENKVDERTASLTVSNKKLQSYIIKNGNVTTKLQQQKIELEKQKKHAVERNNEIEKAFKKSSKQHIKLQKVLLENEKHRTNLEETMIELKATNDKLNATNEEIKSQRDHIEQQREEIESQRDAAVDQRDKIRQHQKEINDNISYARRIQQALLPTDELLKQILPDNFVFNQPKDIVSGDFYWVAQNRNYSVVAVADCTGHGISGAMMSMLATGYLNEIVNKNDITTSAGILEHLRERIITSLHQQEGEGIEFSRDGLDISVCVIDIVESKIEFSGANNALYLYRNDELIEIKPDKMPIGIHEFYEELFKTTTISLVPDDAIYMFSDGYADQFGGLKGKKLKYKRFKHILQQMHKLPMTEQRKLINDKFFEWKGEQEQVDDVMVLGFKTF